MNPSCTYKGCSNPQKSPRFCKIDGSPNGNWAEGRNWKLLDGMVLCNACYIQYRRKGSLERKRPSKRKGRGHAEYDVEPQDDDGGGPAMRPAEKKGKKGDRDVSGPSAAGPCVTGHDEATDTVPPGGIKT